MSDWQQFGVAFLLPLAVVLAPKIADAIRERKRDRIAEIEAERQHRLTDHEVGEKLRDELVRRVDRLTEEVEECESDRKSLRAELDGLRGQFGELQHRFMRLEQAQRRGEPDAFRDAAA